MLTTYNFLFSEFFLELLYEYFLQMEGIMKFSQELFDDLAIKDICKKDKISSNMSIDEIL